VRPFCGTPICVGLLGELIFRQQPNLLRALLPLCFYRTCFVY
jgi:hypothetical protein